MQNHQKILLIEPPFYRLFKDTYSVGRYPLALGYLAGTIKQETDWDVMAYNADFVPQSHPWEVSYLANEGFKNYLANLNDISKPVWRTIKTTIQQYKPTVVGISAKTQNFASACLVAKLTKELNKDIVVIVGGPHPSMVGPDVLDCPDIDIGVRGEGERTLVELLDAITSREQLTTIKGIFYREHDQIVENAQRELIDDLDALCFPHETAPEVLKDYERYPLNAFGNILAIRGCPYNCFFCGSRKIWTRRVRFRSPENVIKEIKTLQQKGLNRVRFDDDTFGINRQYIHNLCHALMTHCPGIQWECELHVKLVQEEIISLMKAAGCVSIQIGIESGNNTILQHMRKNFTIEEAFAACKMIKKHGITLQAFFMIGFPQETEDTLKDTIQAMKRIKSDSLVYSIFTPYPGTEAFDFCRDHGVIGDNYNPALYNHQSPANNFTIHISSERLRTLASQIEKMVDRKNAIARKKEFVLWSLRRIRELGFAASLQKGLKFGRRLLKSDNQ